MKFMFALLVTVPATSANAEYVRIGPMNATVCSGIVIKTCGQKVVSAVEQGGNLFEPTGSFGSVDSHEGSTCHIKTSSENVVTSAQLALKLPKFFTSEQGRLVRISPDYVSFKCQKR
jgi:hypothetical protein